MYGSKQAPCRSILLFHEINHSASTVQCTPYRASNEANFSLATIYYGIKTKFIGPLLFIFEYLNIYERYMLCDGFEPPMNWFILFIASPTQSCVKFETFFKSMVNITLAFFSSLKISTFNPLSIRIGWNFSIDTQTHWMTKLQNKG